MTKKEGKYESEHLDALTDEDMGEHAQSIHGPLLMGQVEEQEKDLVQRVKRMIRVPEGTSAYQAAWMDNEEGRVRNVPVTTIKKWTLVKMLG